MKEAELHRSIPVEPRETPDDTVPLEEALLVDTVEQRRKLILSVLKDDPARYYDLLQQARLNDDSEVVHYAATALAQVSKQADLALQQHARRYAEAGPAQQAQVRAEYAAYLEEYLASGLAQGQAAQLWRRQLEALLKAELAQEVTYPLGCRLAKVQLALEEYEEAGQTLAALIRRWPVREEAWLLCLRRAAARHSGPEVRSVLRQMAEQQVYLSAAGRQEAAFWKGGSA